MQFNYIYSVFCVHNQAGRTSSEDTLTLFAEKKGNRMVCSALSRPSQTMVSIIFEDVIRFVRVNVSQDSFY